MNDLERRLHGALRDAAADPLVPGGLLTEASRRATRIRRRRVATRSAFGAAAVVATGAVVARPAAPGPIVAASASPSASVSATASPAANVLRITVTRVPCEMEQGAPADCVRGEVDVEDSGPSVAVEDTFALESTVEGDWQPSAVQVVFRDGTSVTAPLRQVSESRWVAEIPGRTKADVHALTLPGSGKPVTLDRVPAQETPAAG